MGRRIALLLLILGFGATVETAWRLREAVGFGPLDLRLLGGKFYGHSFAFETEEAYPVPPDVAVEVDNALGAVHVHAGAPGAVRVKLRKIVFRPHEDQARQFAERIRLETALAGTALRVTTNREALEKSGEARGVGFETHLTLAVPPGTVVTVRNEHGAVRVADVAAADLMASFDEVTAERVAGPVVVKAAHGDVRVARVEGPLSLSARHGDVQVQEVTREATLEVRHGNVTVDRTGGLTLDAAHGELSVRAVQGDLVITASHAPVQAVEVTGRVQVETSYHDVGLSKVGGEARVKAHHGAVDATDIGGALLVETSYADVTVARVAGMTDVTVAHGGLRATDVQGGLRARASGDEVVLEGFAGAVEVQADRAAVRLRPRLALVAPVSVRTTQGSVELRVPDGSRFDLDASTTNGELAVNVPRLQLTRSEANHVLGRLGAGGPSVTLFAAHGDVRVEAAEAAPALAEGEPSSDRGARPQ